MFSDYENQGEEINLDNPIFVYYVDSSGSPAKKIQEMIFTWKI